MKEREWCKIAEEYFDNLSSPFEKGVINPIPKIISKMKNKKKLDVIDIGTGIGNLLPLLEKNFRSVYALDFSDQMLKIAKKRTKKSSNVEITKRTVIKRLRSAIVCSFCYGLEICDSIFKKKIGKQSENGNLCS